MRLNRIATTAVGALLIVPLAACGGSSKTKTADAAPALTYWGSCGG